MVGRSGHGYVESRLGVIVMGNFTVDTGDGGTYKITQNAGDQKAGYERGGDYSRISAYEGEEGDGPNGVHTGSNSETVGRRNQAFGQNQ